MNQREALEAAVLSGDCPLGVLADWLEEAGEQDEADWIRAGCPPVTGPYPAAWVRYGFGFGDSGGFGGFGGFGGGSGGDSGDGGFGGGDDDGYGYGGFGEDGGFGGGCYGGGSGGFGGFGGDGNCG